ncbi:GBF-interacting protein 1-like isoform X1 [Actinidia eriantha]|uniref:GBF-interacting protein 1-like isoform X1 n=1 Tax=Actinidia eriantha TaxID=165200 RepID=UPI00258DD208|nr:GBF-interacting protein 1-like isoform X1 [Actinidia eriantha]
MSSGARVSIPNNVRKTIQNIKEIAGNHSDEEIYAMLKECFMDPNETAQKLLFQDPFHEVKRKRDRKKEKLSNKESAESRRRPAMQGRGSRGGRGNYSSRYILNDASGGRNFASGKENGINQVSEEGIGSQESKNKEINPATSCLTAITNGPTAGSPGGTGLVNQSEGDSSIGISKLGAPPTLLHPASTKANPSIEFGKGQTDERLASSLSNISTAETQAPSPGVYFSAADPVLVPSNDSRVPGAVGAIKREVESKRMPVSQSSLDLSDGKSNDGQTLQKALEVGSSSMEGNMPSKSIGVGKNQLSDSAQLVSSTHDGSSVIRPSSNYNSRSQQLIGPQKVGPIKEWKPKRNPNLARESGTAGSVEAPTTVETNTHTQASFVLSVLDSKEDTIKLQRKLEDLHISDGQHVIIPNHLHVPEAEKIGFCFGSFDASFGLNTSANSGPENDSNTTPLSETSESVEETADESSSDQNPIVTNEEGAYPDQPQSPRLVPEKLSSGEGDVSSTAVPQYIESKQETALPGSRQYSMLHPSSSYSFGFMPSMVGSQLAPFESSDSQARDVSRVPSFVIPQLFDPASYYAQFFRSGADSDGRISPFHSSGVTTKFNGNVAVLSPQPSQSAEEGGNSLVLSTASPTPLVTQAAGAMQSSIGVAQQPLPVFRQPTGMPIAHYHPNFVPYGHYFPPFYVPLSNGAFPQQPQASGIYPALPGGTSKYSLPQYKVGSNTGNSTHVAVAGNFGPYSSSPAGYNPSSTSTAGNSPANEDLATSQFKDSNVYISGQQSEGSTVWVTAPGRDISGLQANSFYNIPPQSQVAFTPPQPGHGTYPSIYHPAQTVTATTVHPLLQMSHTMASAADIAGPTASVYQQPRHAQINWPSNY